ncbi:hypothetical protein NXS98_02085 [Fontisphaera persica]|uniref:hypothetical protein n=1 Tax=Fontisphaera persica TaxID=2974023 RepID=UPI0024BF28D8|nr:hypothetical protein [Fontisphaera persica]WCJ59936.1 hypothetical protein NXS98_02085 [Fontisphaera persica]
MTWLLIALGVLCTVPWRMAAQNIVEVNGQNLTLPRLELQEADWERLVGEIPDWPLSAPGHAETRRVAAKLEAHVLTFLEGYPWRPMHHTLGISGYETAFGHPDEMFYALALTLPYLSQPLATRVREFGRAQMEAGVLPFAGRGPDWSKGRPREAYEVPEGYRAGAPAAARSLFGVYSFWVWCHATGDGGLARRFWPRVKEVVTPLLKSNYTFDPLKRDYENDEAEQLNGHLAGALGYARLARLNGDEGAMQAVRRRGLQWLQWRVDLERLNPKILEKSTRSASKSLHNNKLARYCALTPEIGAALRRHAQPVAAQRLAAFRWERNGWWMAFGDRLVGGENYTNPLNFSRSLFAAAMFIEAVPAETLVGWVDIPWCSGDYYFMEKCALVLWQAGGGKWKPMAE